MTESFIKAAKVKQDIERCISELDTSKHFTISHSDSQFLQTYERVKLLLEEESGAISLKIESLQEMIQQLDKQIDADPSMSAESRQIQKKKALNLEGQVKELQTFLRRIKGKKRDAMREESEKHNLYGAGRYVVGDSMAVSQRNKEAIQQNTRLGNEMLDSGRDILHSFRNQSNTLKVKI